MKVVLCGGSNGSHVLAATLGGRPDVDLHLLTRRPEAWQAQVSCTEHVAPVEAVPWLPWQRQREHVGTVTAHAWSAAPQVLVDADLVLLVGPVHAHRPMLERVLPHLRPRPVLLGTLYAQGGFNWLVDDVAAQLGVDLSPVTRFGLQHYPFLCKADRYGQHAHLYGRFPALRMAATGDADAAARALESLLARPVTRLRWLSCTLTLSNQILHPAITWGLLRERGADTRFEAPPPFYGSCTVEAAGKLAALIDEIRRLGRALDPGLEREIVGDPGVAILMAVQDRVPLRLHRRLAPLRDRAVKRMFAINQRLGPARLPTQPAPDGQGLVARVDSRFWLDDIPHGLCVLSGLAELVGLEVPVIRGMIREQQRWMGQRYLDAHDQLVDPLTTSAPQRYGLSLEQARAG
ncbi:MAG: NAD/NADP octopine/nopaline dehydrogenase family protein [Alphaproteobacteria bacterium]|nr:NAD/NADP octopine/nopaline dehydrogenase family protein [Alphaproteobacteria bacterium]